MTMEFPDFQHAIALEGNVYFASDFHLENTPESRVREEEIVRWLDGISDHVQHLFLLGDIFDFWFEYKDVVPRGYYSFFAKLAELKKKNVEFYYFTGNHDMWVKDYFAKEFGMRIFRQPTPFIINGKRCLIGHGDGLDKRDKGYLLIKRIFNCRFNIALYGALPPRWAFAIARACSHKSRQSNSSKKKKLNENEASVMNYIHEYLQHSPADYFIFGHRHRPLEIPVNDTATYYNTGDWLFHKSYLKWTEGGIELKGEN